LLCTVPEQQLFSALDEQMFVGTLQTAPFARQPLPLSQRPTGSPAFALRH
jgi:hypothetical protein